MSVLFFHDVAFSQMNGGFNVCPGSSYVVVSDATSRFVCVPLSVISSLTSTGAQLLNTQHARRTVCTYVRVDTHFRFHFVLE